MVKYRNRYWREEYFEALELIEAVNLKYNLTMYEVALRWLQYHSQLNNRFNDGIVVGKNVIIKNNVFF